MSKSISIALDAMGGDNAPEMVISAAVRSLQLRADLNLLVFGDKGKIETLIKQHESLGASITSRISVHHTDSYISSSEKPSVALKKYPSSSMRLAIESVKEGKAAGVVSAGNTGALMAISKFVLRTLPGIDRPAIASLFPSIKGDTVVLDLGANVECDANNLFQFALMGDAFAKAALKRPDPKIGLLNVGSEEVKGNDIVKAASQLIRDSGLGLNFHGFVEGNDLTSGIVDVIVTDGFTGNVALKTAEGVAKYIVQETKGFIKKNPLAMLGALLAMGSLKKAREKMDPNKRSGGIFLGLNGVVVKSHGSSDAESFSTAIMIAHDTAKFGLTDRLTSEISSANTRFAKSLGDVISGKKKTPSRVSS